MGTRHIVAVVVDDEVKVAQYGQWDGHIDGQGKTIADFLKKFDIESFKNRVRNCKFISDDLSKKIWVECGADPNSDSVSFEISDNHERLYPTLSRNTGAKVLQLIADGHGLLRNDIEFVADSLMCEFAYVLDLDNEVLEIYKGFNQGDVEVGQRFSELPKVVYNHCDYNVVKLIAELPFEQVNMRNLKALEKEIYKDEAV